MTRTYEKAIVATANISKTTKMSNGSLYFKTEPYFSMTVSIAMVTDIWVKVVRNHANQ